MRTISTQGGLLSCSAINLVLEGGGLAVSVQDVKLEEHERRLVSTSLAGKPRLISTDKSLGPRYCEKTFDTVYSNFYLS